jgi:hypothetical protein
MFMANLHDRPRKPLLRTKTCHEKPANLLLSGHEPEPKTTTVIGSIAPKFVIAGPSPIPDSRPSRQPFKAQIWDEAVVPRKRYRGTLLS